MTWNDNWRDDLEDNMYIRLCECVNTRTDILAMSKLVVKYNLDKDPEDCLCRILEWVGNWNNQFEVADLPQDMYLDYLNKLENYKKLLKSA